MWILSPLLFAASLLVDSDSNCPSSQEVQTRFEKLIGTSNQASSRTAVLRRTEAGLRLTLRETRSTEPLAERVLSLDRSCEELSELAATVLASWEAQFPSSDATVALAPPITPTRAWLSWTPWISGGGAWQGGQGTVRWRAGLTAAFRERFRLWAGYADEGRRSRTLGVGTARWAHRRIDLGAAYRVARGRLFLDSAFLFSGAQYRARGRGYSEDFADVAYGFGVGPELRAGICLKHLEIWVSTGATGWLTRPTLAVSGTESSSATLPRFTLQASAGAGWRFP